MCSEWKRELTFTGILILVIALFLIALPYLYLDQSLPLMEGHNADVAYDWYMETHPEVVELYNNNGPTCSLMAREWIDTYREYHNLTPAEYPCAIWYNNMYEWFYY
jgi:hypothetical protein